jgi:signal peptidase I
MARHHRQRSVRAVLLFVIVAGAFFYAFKMNRVDGKSMYPTFKPGQWLLVRRLNWPAPPLRIGEVIVFKKEGDEIVKRVVALPGQRPPAAGEYAMALARSIAHDTMPKPVGELGNLMEPVPQGQVYVLGDNLPNSEDSRDFGPIPMNTVLGRVLSWQEAKRNGAPAQSARAREVP